MVSFYKSNPKLMFYYNDTFIDMSDPELLIKSYFNLNNYASIDANYQTVQNYFVRKNEISEPAADGYPDLTYTSATIA